METSNIIPIESGAPRRLSDVEREALRASRRVIAALMTPGRAFPSREELTRAWALLQAA